MRLFLLAIGLTFTCSASVSLANKTILEPLPPHKIKGDIRNDSTPTRIGFGYNFQNAKASQRYGVFVYAKGDCSNYTDQKTPTVYLGHTQKVSALVEGSDVLIAEEGNSQNEINGGNAFWPDSPFYQFDLKGKILVLEEVDSNNKSNGTAVACGIHP